MLSSLFYVFFFMFEYKASVDVIILTLSGIISLCETTEKSWDWKMLQEPPINTVMTRKLVKFQFWADCPFNVHCRGQVDALPDHECLCRWMKCEWKVKVIYAC